MSMRVLKSKTKKKTRKKITCRLDVCMTERKETLETLSEKANVSIGTLSKMKHGGDCRISIILRVSKALGVQPIDIYPTLGKAA